MRIFIIIFLLIAGLVPKAQNTTGNPWFMWYPERNSTGDAARAAFAISATSNVMTRVIGGTGPSQCQSFTIGNDLRGYIYYFGGPSGIPTLQVIDPGTGAHAVSVGLDNAVFGYPAIMSPHSIYGFYIAATNKHYIAMSGIGVGLGSVGAVYILDVTDIHAMSLVNVIKIPSTVVCLQNANNPASGGEATRITGMVLNQTTYTSAATKLFLVVDDGVKTGSTNSMGLSGVNTRHPGVWVDITDPFATTTVSAANVHEVAYNTTSTSAALFPPVTGASGGPHQICYEPVNNVVYIDKEDVAGGDFILSFNASTYAPTNNIYALSTPSGGGFHGMYVTRNGTTIYSGCSGGPVALGADRVHKWNIQPAAVSITTTTQAASSPSLSSVITGGASIPNGWIKSVSLTPDETQLYASVQISGGGTSYITSLNPTNLASVGVAQKSAGGTATYNFIDPHSYAYQMADYGDAPVSYGRAAHNLVNLNYVNDLLRIGATIDGDTAARISSGFDGDDLAANPRTQDEDGISIATKNAAQAFYYGMTGTYTINNVPVKNTSPNDAALIAWLDFNNDGIFQTSEADSVDVPIGTTSVNLSWTIPTNVATGRVKLRLRLSTDESLTRDQPSNFVLDGEAEDHIYTTVVPITGNVFSDPDANTIYGSGGTSGTGETGTLGGVPLFAYIIKNGIIVDSAHVKPDGSYNFPNGPQNMGTATVVIGTNSLAPGSAATGITNIATTPPTGYVYTGSSSTSTSNGSSGSLGINVISSATPIANQNFGIQRPPVANNSSMPNQPNTGYSIPVPATQFFGSDPDGTVQNIRITAFPQAGGIDVASITINGVKYTSAGAFNAAFPTGATIPSNTSGNPLAGIFIQPVLGNMSPISIPYVTIDNAGAISPTAFVTVPFATILPVVFGNISVLAKGCAVVVDFNTLTETGNNMFEIERGVDGNSFIKIGGLLAKGSQTTGAAYTYADLTVGNGDNYYRIKQIDKDGRFAYSHVLKVKITCAKFSIEVQPNPFKNIVLVRLQGYDSLVTVSIISMAGRVMLAANATGARIVRFDTSTLPQGSYMICVGNKVELHNVQVVKL